MASPRNSQFAKWDALFRSLRNQGRDVFDAWLNHTRLGYNYRMDEMSAALGVSQLGRIEELLARRERVAGWYNERLKGQDIPSRPYFTPIHLQPFYVQKFGYQRGDFPVTEEAGDTCLALPFSSVMKEEQVAVVCGALKAAIGRR